VLLNFLSSLSTIQSYTITNLFFVSIDFPLGIFHVNWIVQYMIWLLLRSTMFLRFIHAVTVFLLHLILWWINVPLYDNIENCLSFHLLMDRSSGLMSQHAFQSMPPVTYSLEHLHSTSYKAPYGSESWGFWPENQRSDIVPEKYFKVCIGNSSGFRRLSLPLSFATNSCVSLGQSLWASATSSINLGNF
jgi:hypothetical protein